MDFFSLNSRLQDYFFCLLNSHVNPAICKAAESPTLLENRHIPKKKQSWDSLLYLALECEVCIFVYI